MRGADLRARIWTRGSQRLLRPRAALSLAATPCAELTWFRHERRAPAGLLASRVVATCAAFPGSLPVAAATRAANAHALAATVAGTAQFQASRPSLRSRW